MDGRDRLVVMGFLLAPTGPLLAIVATGWFLFPAFDRWVGAKLGSHASPTYAPRPLPLYLALLVAALLLALAAIAMIRRRAR